MQGMKKDMMSKMVKKEMKAGKSQKQAVAMAYGMSKAAKLMKAQKAQRKKMK